MAGRTPREVDFQADLYFLLRQAIEKRTPFGGVNYGLVKQEAEVEKGRADLVVYLTTGEPFLVIETKRKDGRERKDFDPFSSKVIAQARNYAVALGAPYFATATKEYLALFRVPRPGERFTIERHRVLITDIDTLGTEFVERLLTRLGSYDLADEADREKVATSIDWSFIIRLRSFVDWLTRRISSPLQKRFQEDAAFLARVEAAAKESGAALAPSQLAREMAYILTNRIVFYKMLESQYHLNKLTVKHVALASEIPEYLGEAFRHATRRTGNFEAIFLSGIYDEYCFSNNPPDLLDTRDGLEEFIEDMETYRLLEQIETDIIGHVYEDLIPAEERHQLGQFYTPPQIAEFLTRWAIRKSSDKVLDPATGSGTFPVKAYQRLGSLKRRQRTEELHRELLSQLFAIDINAFPAHLTGMNLAMRDVRHPVKDMNIVRRDFFQVSVGSALFVPYGDEEQHKIVIPKVDAVVGNPPFTRWTELPEATKDAINGRLKKPLKDYGLTAQVRAGIEPALYQHFLLHAHDFLVDGGRFAMIVSNAWLQNDIGVKWCNYILDHFKVRAVIDLGPRVFKVPMVATCMLLLERCETKRSRDENTVLLAYVDKTYSVDDLLDLVANPEAHKERSTVFLTKQGEVPRGMKWIEVMFGIPKLNAKIRAGSSVSSYFNCTRGTVKYCADHKRGLGANEFFYFDEAKRLDWDIPPKFLAPALVNAGYFEHFEFADGDWRELKKQARQVYLLDVSAPRSSLPAAVLGYIEWGETKCKTKKTGVTCSKSQACQERAKKPGYYGWYDAGGVSATQFFTPYYARYLRRFALTHMKLALDSDFLAFTEKKHLSKTHLKATLACLHSAVVQSFVELAGRSSGGLVQGLEAKQAMTLPLPDFSKVPKPIIEALAESFDLLEKRSREVGGAKKIDVYETFEKHLAVIDRLAAKAFGLTFEELKQLKTLNSVLRNRRLSRAKEGEPELLKGEDRPMTPKPKPVRRISRSAQMPSLDRFREPEP